MSERLHLDSANSVIIVVVGLGFSIGFKRFFVVLVVETFLRQISI
jgi:hypothetical protein